MYDLQAVNKIRHRHVLSMPFKNTLAKNLSESYVQNHHHAKTTHCSKCG